VKRSLLIVAIALACTQQTSSPPSRPAPPPPAAQQAPRVILPDNFAVQVEVAADDPTREQGLMFRDRMAEDRGMIFIFPANGAYPFWMKNTLIPLDMIFIGADWRIAGIVQNAEPKTLSAREVAGNSQYVLEIGGGLSARYGFRAGQLVDFQAGSTGK